MSYHVDREKNLATMPQTILSSLPRAVIIVDIFPILVEKRRKLIVIINFKLIMNDLRLATISRTVEIGQI